MKDPKEILRKCLCHFDQPDLNSEVIRDRIAEIIIDELKEAGYSIILSSALNIATDTIKQASDS